MEIIYTLIQWVVMYAIVVFILSGQVKKYSLIVAKKYLFSISLIALVLLFVSYIVLSSGISVMILENKSLIQGISKTMVSVLIFISYMIIAGGSIFAFYFTIRIGLGKILEEKNVPIARLIASNTTGNFVGITILIAVIIYAILVLF